ncbi:MAG: hypothetical protein HYR51_17765 [Candidatus Rokubacteria bacterium]|nr:hypothetical protein [Candidatus Rokubacteria bacterium]
MRHALFVLLLVFTGCAVQTAAPATPRPAAVDPLRELNASFRTLYTDARGRTLAEVGPFILHKGDTAVLVRDGRRVEAPVNVPVYHALKAVAHIPLAIYVGLTPGEGALDDARVAALTRLRDQIAPAIATLAGRGFTGERLSRQEALAARAREFLDGILARRRYTRDELTAFTRATAAHVLANATEATRAQLDALHRQVSEWRAQMSPAEWARLHVVVIGPHMPRDGETSTQYYLRLLGEPAEGRRVVYAESMWQEPQALELLGTHILDGGIGEAFFGDFMRMHRDLLADAAADHLKSLLPGR